MPTTPALHRALLAAPLAFCFGASAQCAGPGQGATAAPEVETLSPYDQIGNYVREVFQDRDGHYWFGTANGVCRYDGASLTYFLDQIGTSWGVDEILQGADGALWFAGPGVIGYKDGAFTKFSAADGLSHPWVLSLMLDRSGTVWAGTRDGVCRLEGEAFVPFPIPKVTSAPGSRAAGVRASDLAWDMAEDHDGNLWFGLSGEGVRKFDGARFTAYTTEDGLAGNDVRSVYVDRRGHLWFGTNKGGVSRFDGESFQTFTKEDGLSSDAVWGTVEDATGALWFSGNGASRYDGETFTVFRGDPRRTINGGPAHLGVMEMFSDEAGHLWFGCTDGLWRLDGDAFVNVTKKGPRPAPPR